MQPDELLAEVEVGGIWAVQYGETPLSDDLLNYSSGAVYSSVIIEKYEGCF